MYNCIISWSCYYYFVANSLMRHSLTVLPRQATRSDPLSLQLSPWHPHHWCHGTESASVCRVTRCVHPTRFIGCDTSCSPSKYIFFLSLHLQRYTQLGVCWRPEPPLRVPPSIVSFVPLPHLRWPELSSPKPPCAAAAAMRRAGGFYFFTVCFGSESKSLWRFGVAGAEQETRCVWRGELQGDYVA